MDDVALRSFSVFQSNQANVRMIMKVICNGTHFYG